MNYFNVKQGIPTLRDQKMRTLQSNQAVYNPKRNFHFMGIIKQRFFFFFYGLLFMQGIRIEIEIEKNFHFD